jgi:hypothetical protein
MGAGGVRRMHAQPANFGERDVALLQCAKDRFVLQIFDRMCVSRRRVIQLNPLQGVPTLNAQRLVLCQALTPPRHPRVRRVLMQ